MMNKFDKIEQGRRAAAFEKSQAALGLTKPTLPMPIIKKKGSGIYDMLKCEFKVGDYVARTWADKGFIEITRIVRIEAGKVYLEDNRMVVHPDRMLVVNELSNLK